MSSTSNDVCELWNGDGLVKVLGTAPVRAFMCLLPLSEGARGARGGTVVLDLKSAVEHGVLEIYGRGNDSYPPRCESPKLIGRVLRADHYHGSTKAVEGDRSRRCWNNC